MSHQIEYKRIRENRNIFRFARPLQERRRKHRTGAVPLVQDPRARVPPLHRERKLLPLAIKRGTPLDQLPYPVGPFPNDNFDHAGIPKPATDPHRIFHVGID